MTLGKAPTHEDLFWSSREFCEELLPESSIYRLLAREGHRLIRARQRGRSTPPS